MVDVIILRDVFGYYRSIIEKGKTTRFINSETVLYKIITVIKSYRFFLSMLMLSPLIACSQIKDNPQLRKMFEDDQAARRVSKIDWRVVSKQDSIELIKSESTKGNNALYNISEDGINTFGYDLVGLKKLNDALVIFKLNTALYPTAFNAFDSLGECLLMLNRREEGINAYRKSLNLNPNNENAKKIIDETE